MDEFVVPKGKYWLGDPCYCFKPHEKWTEVLKKSDFFEREYKEGKRISIAFRTTFGDGEYLDEEGNSYPVDAGLIGLTNIKLAIKKPFGSRLVEFTEPTICYKDGGLLVFGNTKIQTDDSEL